MRVVWAASRETCPVRSQPLGRGFLWPHFERPPGYYGAGNYVLPLRPRFHALMADPFIREKFAKEQSFARQLAKEYFEKYPKDRYQTEVESWRKLQSDNIEFVMKRLREPLK
jgi:hypothetical protein